MTTPVSCEDARLLLSNLLARTVEAEETKALDHHLSVCEQCRKLSVELVEQDLAIRELVVRSSLEVADGLQASLRNIAKSEHPKEGSKPRIDPREIEALPGHPRRCESAAGVVEAARQATGETAEIGEGAAAVVSKDRHSRRFLWRRYARPARSSWAVGALAAGLLAGVVLLVVLANGGGRPASPDRDRARRPSAREEEARRLAARGEAQRVEDLREKERMKAEERLREIERERERLLAKPLTPEAKPAPEQAAEREKALAGLEDRKRRIEKEMKEAIERGERAATARAEEKPGIPQEPSKPPKGTETTVATVERVEGEVSIVGMKGKTPAQAGQAVPAGQGVETGAKSIGLLKYVDGTRLEVGAEAVLRELREEGGKRLFVAKGEIRAVVAKQPKDQPMVLATPYGEARVVGTTLRIVVDPDPKKGMRLEVEEGRVEFRNLAGKTVDVPSGHYAVAAVGVEFIAKPIPIPGEILILPRQGRIIGNGWRFAKDPEASTGLALESFRASEKTSQAQSSWPGLEFTFRAEANKEYSIWIRGRTMATKDQQNQDSIIIEIPDSIITEPESVDQDYSKGPTRAIFDGFMHRPGYWWIGGAADRLDVPPDSVRFQRSGLQILRIHSYEPPVRIDAIWISTSQKTRPDNNHPGPPVPRK